jgi:hypothetical protein
MLGQVLKLGPAREGGSSCNWRLQGSLFRSGWWLPSRSERIRGMVCRYRLRSGQGQVCASQLALGMGAYDGRDVRARHGVDIRLCKAVGAV